MPIFRLSLTHTLFPSPTLSEPDGLLAVGGDLSEKRLLKAYREGIFPWYSEGEPILWWSPDPRAVLFLDDFHVSRRFLRYLKRAPFHFSLDEAFADVVRACATIPRRDQDGTWITPEMEGAYARLHRAGYAHSLEVWAEDKLVGGVYGVSLGACFFGESMFSAVENASKAGLYILVQQLKRWAFSFIDCQFLNPHLERLGARNIARAEFLKRLAENREKPTRRGRWTLDNDLTRVPR
jgi:leucyl/phenylalanyl-tRNA--protein transferase